MRGQRITAISNETLAAAEVLPISMLQATSFPPSRFTRLVRGIIHQSVREFSQKTAPLP